MSMTFHEWYGDVSVSQLRAYRKHNISPSDHDDLTATFGDDPEAIVRAVKDIVAKYGYFSTYYLYLDHYRPTF